jgi:hypothetical protein
MGVTSTQGFKFRLIANGTQLDLFDDEEIFVSNNVTGLFDLGVLPSDFTRQITVPGTKKNNQFFEFVYDISVENPYTFATNQKVEAYIDYDGIYVSQGYLQLNKVNVVANKFIDSYEVSVYGSLSSFGRDANRIFLTDLTSSLAKYNHTASVQNITSSWEGNLLSGDIIYPFAEYGQKIQYSPEEPFYGIDGPSGSLTVQDYKPAIKLKKLWDACFETLGYTYSSSFLNQSWVDEVYFLANNNLRYLQLSGSFYGTSSINLETYGQFKIAPFSGSGQTNVTLPFYTNNLLPWYSVQLNSSPLLDGNLNYTVQIPTQLRGQINLNFQVQPTSSTSTDYPQFSLIISGSSGSATVPLTQINNYMSDVSTANTPFTKDEKFTLLSDWNSPQLGPGSYKFYLRVQELLSGSTSVPDINVILDPGGKPESFLSLTKVNQAADGKVIDLATQMPYGTAGIKIIDFLKAVQKKFNLIIYPNKLKFKEFVVETFNEWIDKGVTRNFDRYVNLDEKIEVIPANNLAVNELRFGDTLDRDYVSQQFNDLENREFGQTYYIDTENFFSQGELKVQSGFASSPLIYLAGTGTSGSGAIITTNKVSVSDASVGTESIVCLGSSYTNDVRRVTATLVDSSGNTQTNFGAPITVEVKFDLGLCYGGSTTTLLNVVIPYGSSVGTLDYYSTAYVDCGSSPCTTETLTVDCVNQITGQTGIAIYSSSPISMC